MTGKGSESYHRPVMAGEVVKLLITAPEGAYLDLTAGGGGHLKALSVALGKRARLYGIDKDVDAVEEAGQVMRTLPQTGLVCRESFGNLDTLAPQLGETEFDGILIDLGLSSHHIDDPSRGFSFQEDGPLDMRFDRSGTTTAADLVNNLSEKELTAVIKEYGEERGAARIARAIVKERQNEEIRTTRQLAAVVFNTVRPPHQKKSLARVFQSLRIAVNRELDELRQVLPAAISLLRSGGRLAVISYHSLEDRIVKRFMQQNSRVPEITDFPVPVDPEARPQLRILTKKPVTPEEQEIQLNSRARSARLRVAEKN